MFFDVDMVINLFGSKDISSGLLTGKTDSDHLGNFVGVAVGKSKGDLLGEFVGVTLMVIYSVTLKVTSHETYLGWQMKIMEVTCLGLLIVKH